MTLHYVVFSIPVLPLYSLNLSFLSERNVYETEGSMIVLRFNLVERKDLTVPHMQ
jgi:hypothetical protein